MMPKKVSVAILALKKKGMSSEDEGPEDPMAGESEDTEDEEDTSSFASAVDAVSDSFANAVESGDKLAIKKAVMNLASILRK